MLLVLMCSIGKVCADNKWYYTSRTHLILKHNIFPSTDVPLTLGVSYSCLPFPPSFNCYLSYSHCCTHTYTVMFTLMLSFFSSLIKTRSECLTSQKDGTCTYYLMCRHPRVDHILKWIICKWMGAQCLDALCLSSFLGWSCSTLWIHSEQIYIYI